MSTAANRFRERVVEGALYGPGRVDVDARLAAFHNHGVDERAKRLIDKVARHAWEVTDDDVAATKAASVSEDAIFELVELSRRLPERRTHDQLKDRIL